jgi:hypothetical protein
VWGESVALSLLEDKNGERAVIVWSCVVVCEARGRERERGEEEGAESAEAVAAPRPTPPTRARTE